MVASTLVPPASSERTPYGPGLLEGSPGRRRGLGAHAQGRTEDGCTDRQECSVQPRGNRLIRRHRAARRGRTLYLLDEPTTGLHPADVQLLMGQLNRLVDAANTVIVVEHHMDVVAAADWVIDLGPAGGDSGGKIVATGPPAQIAGDPRSRTGFYLAERLGLDPLTAFGTRSSEAG